MKSLKKEKIIIFGFNNYADIFFNYLKHDKRYEVVAYTINREYIEETVHNGVPVVAFEDILTKYPPKDYKLIVTIGYKNMNKDREQIYKKLKDLGYNLLTYIHPSAIIQSNDIDEGCLVMSGVIIESGCKIGKCNIFNPNTLISHNANIGNFNFFAGSSSLAGDVTVKNNCFLGLNSTIKNGVTIESFSLIGAGAYINKNTETFGVYVPERSVKLTKKSLDVVI